MALCSLIKVDLQLAIAQIVGADKTGTLPAIITKIEQNLPRKRLLKINAHALRSLRTKTIAKTQVRKCRKCEWFEEHLRADKSRQTWLIQIRSC